MTAWHAGSVEDKLSAEIHPGHHEAVGHLAAALLPLMARATDERLETLLAPHFSPIAALAFELGTASSLALVLCRVFTRVLGHRLQTSLRIAATERRRSIYMSNTNHNALKIGLVPQ